jgi:hypothetical protein
MLPNSVSNAPQRKKSVRTKPCPPYCAIPTLTTSARSPIYILVLRERHDKSFGYEYCDHFREDATHREVPGVRSRRAPDGELRKRNESHAFYTIGGRDEFLCDLDERRALIKFGK